LKTEDEIKTDLRILKELMFLEETAETNQIKTEIGSLSETDAEKLGLLVSKLEIFENDLSFGGRHYYRLRKVNQQIIPFTKVTVGCVVSLVSSINKTEILRGIVQVASRNEIKIVSDIELKFGELKGAFQIEINADNITYKRIRQGLEAVEKKLVSKENNFLIHLLRGGAIDSWKFEGEIVQKYYENNELNLNQVLAIRKIISGSPLTIIHGPPGTGKTNTLLQAVKVLVENHKKVFICAGTNTATDHIAEGLLGLNINTVRIGHPARISEKLYSITLEKMLGKTEAGCKSLVLEKELADTLRQKDKRIQKGRYLDSDEFKSEKNLIYAYRREIENLNRQSMSELLYSNVVFCSTVGNSFADEISRLDFDYIIIDEAAQIIEPLTYLPLTKGQKFILAGDHLQLPPTIISKEAAQNGLGCSFFEKLIKKYPEASCLLNRQYRMHQDILGFSSAYFYQNELISAVENLHEGVLFSDLSFWSTLKNAVFIDTAGADFDESWVETRKSYINQGEARAVAKLIAELIEGGAKPESIGVIAPYRSQAEHIRDLLQKNNVEVSTVDSFQGREKDCIIISLTRSNPDQKIGFLSEERRLNVAMTRAKYKLIILGDGATINSHPIFKAMIEYFQKINGYHSVWEFPQLQLG
jgi:ATP-dependent RNA/DNA helicase IGHMBP2